MRAGRLMFTRRMNGRRLTAFTGVFLLAGLGTAGARSTGVNALLSGLSGKLRAVFALPGQDGRAEPARRLPLADRRAPGAEPDRADSLFGQGQRPHRRLPDGSLAVRAPGGRMIPPTRIPPGFIEVTPHNFGTRVSEHFTLGQFVTKGQDDVWPKYVALDRRLVDKLELTLDELSRSAATRRRVLRDERLPHAGLQRGRRRHARAAPPSRATSTATPPTSFPTTPGSGWISDLNRDGRRDIRDARILRRGRGGRRGAPSGARRAASACTPATALTAPSSTSTPAASGRAGRGSLPHFRLGSDQSVPPHGNSSQQAVQTLDIGTSVPLPTLRASVYSLPV